MGAYANFGQTNSGLKMMIKVITRGLVAIVVMFATACHGGTSGGGYNRAIEGILLEEGSNKPIADAFVIAEWTEYSGNFVSSTTNCRRIEIVRTDNEGRYTIPSAFIVSILGRVVRSVDAYKAGYEEVRKLDMSEAEDALSERRKVMRPFRKSNEARLLGLHEFTALRCGHDTHYYAELLALQLAAAVEASNLSAEGGKHVVVRDLRAAAAQVEYEMKNIAGLIKSKEQ